MCVSEAGRADGIWRDRARRPPEHRQREKERERERERGGESVVTEHRLGMKRRAGGDENDASRRDSRVGCDASEQSLGQRPWGQLAGLGFACHTGISTAIDCKTNTGIGDIL